jgi:integrase/recombinase XerD
LDQVGIGWADVAVEDVARFVAWLRAPAENVIVREAGTGRRRSPATVNRHMAGAFGFYDHHARSGVGVAAEPVAWRRVGRGSYKPFLHHVTKGRPIPTRPVKPRRPGVCRRPSRGAGFSLQGRPPRRLREPRGGERRRPT